MFADALRFTHNGTGGSGTITLAATTGYPQPSDVFGTSGTRIVYYEIAEYTDSTFATLSLYERGIGSLVLSTGVLTRTPQITWTSGGSYVKSGATKLTFGNTAANFQITLGASAMTQRPGHIVAASSAWSGNGYLPLNTRQTQDSTATGTAMTNGNKYWFPIEYIGGFPITTVAVECTTLHAAAVVRFGIYEWDTDGLGGNLISEITSATQFDFSTTGVKSVTPASPLWIPPGLYWGLLQGNDSTAAMRVCVVNGSTLIDASGNRDVVYFIKSGTYGALPSTGDKTSTTTISRSSGNTPWVGYK